MSPTTSRSSKRAAARPQPSGARLNSDLLPFPLPFLLGRLGRLDAIIPEVILRKVAGRDHQLDVGDSQMRSRPPEDPWGRVLLVLVHGLVEVNLVQVAADRQPV